MNHKADLHHWSVLHHAMLVYNSYELEKPTPSQRYVTVLNVKTLPDNTVLPSLDVVYTSQPRASKKASENDVAAAALVELLKLDPFSQYDPLDNVLLACAYAIKDPSSSGAFKMINLLIEAFDYSESGWIAYDVFLLFPTVQTALNKVSSTNMRSPVGSSQCLLAAFSKLVGYEEGTNSERSPLALAAQVLAAGYEEGRLCVRRRKCITEKELAFMQAHNSRILEQRLTSEYGKVQSMNTSQVYCLRMMHLKGETVDDLEVTIPAQHFMISALDRIRNVLGATNLAISRPLFHTGRKTSTHDEKSSGPRLFCDADADAETRPINRVASWLLCEQVRGDVVVANVSIGTSENVDKALYFNLLRSSLPSGLWIRDENLSLMHFPDVFVPDMWLRVPARCDRASPSPIACRLPLQLLEEFAARRTGRGLVVAKERFRDLSAVGDARATQVLARCMQAKVDTRLREEEPLPNCSFLGGIVIPNEARLLSGPTGAAKQPEVRSVAELEEIGRVKLTVPSSLFFMDEDAAAESVVTFVAEVPSSSRTFRNTYLVSNALQYCAFYALSAAEHCGQRALIGSGQQYRVDVKLQCNVHLGEVSAAECQHDYVEFRLSTMCYEGFFAAYLGSGMLPPTLDRAIQPLNTENCIAEVALDLGELPFKTWSFDCSTVSDKCVSFIIKLVTRQRAPPAEPECEKRQYQLFKPPLQVQRCSLVVALLNSVRAVSWLDVGCGEGQLLLSTAAAAPGSSLDCPSLQYAAGLDPNRQKLQRARLLNAQEDISHSPRAMSREFFVGSATNLGGSVLAAREWDVVTCMEVIEHLPSVDDAARMALAVLSLLPRFAVFSTPNKEANVLIRAAARGELSQHLRVEPTLEDDQPRHYDHHFEFTRREFTDWCERVLVLARVDYSIEYTTLGNLLPHMRRTVLADGTVCQGYGGATQVAIFARIGLSKPSCTVDIANREIELLWGF